MLLTVMVEQETELSKMIIVKCPIFQVLILTECIVNTIFVKTYRDIIDSMIDGMDSTVGLGEYLRTGLSLLPMSHSNYIYAWGRT